MQGRSFWLAVRLNTVLRMRFLCHPHDDCTLGPLVQRFYWLANRSHVFRGLNSQKRSRKENRQIESRFLRPTTWSPCHPLRHSLRHHCHFTQSPQIDRPLQHQFAQNGVEANCYRQSTYLRTKTPLLLLLYMTFFNHCIMNRYRYLQLLTSVPNLSK